jgi:hypothetical protein
MAAREHQGYQIALVIFVMLTVLLSITTFMFFKKYREEQQKYGEVVEQRETVTKDKDALDNRLAQVLPLLGFTKEETLDAINKMVADDRKALEPYKTLIKGEAAAAAPQDEGFGDEAAPEATEISNPLQYRDIVKALKLELDIRSAAMVALTADKQKLEQAVAANRVEDKAKIDAATAGQVAAQTELDSEKQKMTAGRAEKETQVATLTEALNKKDEDSKKLDAELNDKIKQLTDANTARGRQMAEMRDTIESQRPKNFETPDGRVTYVLAAERLVYINLGSADNLRPQVTFSVYNQDSAKLVESESKAQLEVTQISGPHSAVARVLSDSRKDPILPGDVIFSPAFHPGSKVHFAIVGITDIDKDGDSDRQKIRDLIATNGGVIDIEVDDDGKLLGTAKPLDVNSGTQYLVQGSPPTDNKVLDQYSRIIGNAKTTGTSIISVQQFLNMMGYKSDERTVGLGKGADPRDFLPQGGSNAYDKPGEAKFRERRPAGANK